MPQLKEQLERETTDKVGNIADKLKTTNSKFWTTPPTNKPENNAENIEVDDNITNSEPAKEINSDREKPQQNKETVKMIQNKEDLILNTIIKLTEVITNRENKEIERENNDKAEKEEKTIMKKKKIRKRGTGKSKHPPKK